MPWPARCTATLIALVVVASARAEEAKPSETVTWSKDLPTAFAEAKKAQKVLMICVNAKHVEGRSGEEPAAKWLREVIYRDARVVGKSREFVCVLLTAEGSAEDFAELRPLGIDGDLVSPQHIFVHPDGKEILLRKEYWIYGRGESAVQALLGMMTEALQKGKGEDAADEPAATPDATDPVPEGAARVEWIADRVRQVVESGGRPRQQALDSLIENDRDGDCTAPLIALLPESKKKTILLAALVRALGRDGLEAAAQPIADLLGHRDEAIRANAAVSLEYIGSRDRRVIGALRKAADREKDEAIANHMFRALGRCGVEDGKTRALLLKQATSAKSEFASYGPSIGLAYFEGDEKAARGVEKLLKKIGVPGSKRGGGTNSVKRGVLSWTLAAIGDRKSGEFVREELLAKLEHVEAFWVDGLRSFWQAVARSCEGDEAAMAGIEQGVRVIVEFAKRFGLGRYGAETRGLMDEYRMGRDTSRFQPKGDYLLEAAAGG